MWPPAAWIASTCDRMLVPLASVSSAIEPTPCQPMPWSELSTEASVRSWTPEAWAMATKSASAGFAMSM